VYYEDINEGAELPALVKLPTTMQLVKYAAASGDYYQIHYDKDFALASGLPGVIVHGWLALAFLAQMVTDWMGTEGRLVKLSGSYRGMNLVNEDIICNGKVAQKSTEGGRHLVRIELWAENPRGDRTVTGTAVVALPSRRTAG
ncbi:MAG: MaoC/PaaZ C-terminal domain-containing protein, partial [Dehalococcoidales bacterium]|nr:MaoC/PaaZ C-terminal domain-containing protein [Dehalococcoidales bacterium]